MKDVLKVTIRFTTVFVRHTFQMRPILQFFLKVRYLDDHEMYMSSSVELYKTLPYASGVGLFILPTNIFFLPKDIFILPNKKFI